MKKFMWMWSVLVCCMAVFTACGDDEAPDAGLLGQWQVIRSEAEKSGLTDYAAEGLTEIYRFKTAETGERTFRREGATPSVVPFSYKIEDGKFICYLDNVTETYDIVKLTRNDFRFSRTTIHETTTWILKRID